MKLACNVLKSIPHRSKPCHGHCAAIDRVVHHCVILEFDAPSYRSDAAQQRDEATAAVEVNRQK